MKVPHLSITKLITPSICSCILFFYPDTMKKAPSLSEEVKLLTFALALSSFTFASVIILTFSFIIPTVINHHNHQCKALLPSLKPHYLLATILFFLFIFKVKTIEGCLLVPSLFLHLLLTFWLIQIWVSLPLL